MSDPEIIGPNDRFDNPFADEAYDEPRPGMSGCAKLFAASAVVIGLIAVVAVGWFAFQQGIWSGTEEAAPVVRASPEPFKRKPVDPGGLDVPHQNMLVFNRLVPGQVQESGEVILPPPEEPTERPLAPEIAEPQPTLPAVPEAQSAPSVVEVSERVPAQSVPTEHTAVAPPPPPPVSAPAVEPEKPALAPAPAPVVVAPEPAAKPAATASAGGGWKIQLASVSSRASAEGEWARMKGKNSDLLGALSLNVQTIELDRGTFYRIQGEALGRQGGSPVISAANSNPVNRIA